VAAKDWIYFVQAVMQLCSAFCVFQTTVLTNAFQWRLIIATTQHHNSTA